MCRGTMVLLVCLLLQAPAMGQTVRSVVDCGGKRLTGAERETCASPDLMRLTTDVDQLTGHLEATLTGRNKEALVDTERPFMVERNNCQNATSALHQDYASVVRACVERLLRGRLDALRAAGTSPGSIVSEIGQYSFWSIANFVKWGPELLGKHVRLWGCMALDPGPTPASRIHGTIHDYPRLSSKAEGRVSAGHLQHHDRGEGDVVLRCEEAVWLLARSRRASRWAVGSGADGAQRTDLSLWPVSSLRRRSHPAPLLDADLQPHHSLLEQPSTQ